MRGRAEQAGARPLGGPFCDFLDPRGNRARAVGCADVRFTKALRILKGLAWTPPGAPDLGHER